MAKVSILIPTAFDGLESRLKPCLESIHKFTDLSDTEIIVVANGCTQPAAEYAATMGCINLKFPEAIGYPAAINAGIGVAQGDYVVLLNDDTILLEQPRNQWIEILLRAFWDEKVGISGPMKEWCPWAEYKFILFFCVMLRKKMLDQIGLLDEAFSPGIGEDTDMCCRAQIAGWKVLQVPDDNDYRFYDDKKRLGNFPIWHEGTRTFCELA